MNRTTVLTSLTAHCLLPYHSYTHLLHIILDITGRPVTFNKPLTNLDVMAKETLTMECELTSPTAQVCWQKDGQNIRSDSRIQISCNNCTHKLEIADVTLNDGGTYTCVCGEETTECKITVEGKHCL